MSMNMVPISHIIALSIGLVFEHDKHLACKTSTVKTLALIYNSGTALTIVINDKNAIGCRNPISVI